MPNAHFLQNLCFSHKNSTATIEGPNIQRLDLQPLQISAWRFGFVSCGKNVIEEQCVDPDKIVQMCRLMLILAPIINGQGCITIIPASKWLNYVHLFCGFRETMAILTDELRHPICS